MFLKILRSSRENFSKILKISEKVLNSGAILEKTLMELQKKFNQNLKKNW